MYRLVVTKKNDVIEYNLKSMKDVIDMLYKIPLYEEEYTVRLEKVKTLVKKLK